MFSREQLVSVIILGSGYRLLSTVSLINIQANRPDPGGGVVTCCAYSVLVKDYFLCRAMSEKFASSKNYSNFMSMGEKVALGIFLKTFLAD